MGLCIMGCEKGEISNLLGSPDPVVVGQLITLELEVKHHYRSLPGCNVYLKKNATEFPGNDPSNYDMEAESNPNGFVQFNNLLYGDYYLYVDGYDQDVADSVKGYLPILLDESSVQNNGDDLYSSFIVYVTE